MYFSCIPHNPSLFSVTFLRIEDQVFLSFVCFLFYKTMMHLAAVCLMLLFCMCIFTERVCFGCSCVFCVLLVLGFLYVCIYSSVLFHHPAGV